MTLHIRAALAAAAAAVAAPALAQDYQPESVECIAPANPGGGWDFTCRQVGKTLYDLDLVPSPVQVTNMAGGGGGVAFAAVATKRSEEDDLLVAASSSTSARLGQNAFPGMSMEDVSWIGSVGTDYGVIAVDADSEIETLPELFDMIKEDPTSVSVAGGSAVGGWDHLKVLAAADAAGVEDLRQIKYVAFAGGGEAVTALLGNHVQAFTGDISEAKGFVDSGDIKVLAVLAPERLPGEFSEFPTATEQGIDYVGANWRGFYGPKDMSEEAYQYYADALAQLNGSEEWKTIMEQSGLQPLDIQGDEFRGFVEEQVESARTLSQEIGLIQQ